MPKADFSCLSWKYFLLQWKRSQRETDFFTGLRKIVYLSSAKKTSQAYKTDDSKQLILCSLSIESNAEGSEMNMTASIWRCYFANSINLQDKPSTCVQGTSVKVSLQTHTTIYPGYSTYYGPTTANTGGYSTTVKPMLATPGSIQSRPTYTGGKLTGTMWYYEKWTVNYQLC
jgi:hypothetical protein